METATGLDLRLSDPELRLLIELLESEKRELPSEIHHTDSRALRERLRARLATVEDLLARLDQG